MLQWHMQKKKKKTDRDIPGNNLQINSTIKTIIKCSPNFVSDHQAKKKKIITEPDVLISHVLVMVRLYRSMH